MLSLILLPLGILSSASVALVTLRRGASEGVWVSFSSLIAVSLLGLILFGNYQLTLFLGMVMWLPIWVISVVLRESRNFSLAIVTAMSIGILGVLFLYLYHGDPASMWYEHLQQMFKPMLESMQLQAANEKADLEQFLERYSHVMTGVVASGFVLYELVFSLFIARWWQAVLFNPGGFKQEYLSLHSQRWLAAATLLVIATGLSGFGFVSETASNVAVVLILLYMLTGAAVLHFILAGTKSGHFWIPALYVALIIPHVMMLVAVIGLADTWLNFRNKFSKQIDA
ncbi:MAG: DUF2232 domain-containing protein [Gammaproteobacteria bacterium]